MEIGTKIKDLRLKNGLTQEELAHRCDLSKGYISQLENDLTSPSIASLIDILNVLGVAPADFFAAGEDEQLVFTEADYTVKSYEGYGITWLVPAAQKNMMEPILVTIEPGGGAERDLPHEGEEFGYVLSGAVQITVGKRRFEAGAGESFYYRPDKAHHIVNASKDAPAKFLWLSCPPNF
ncbi:MAG: XRE family transcriptional regulator [Clostridiales bacterium]|jgi:transcriptional regulator with XRE-family HTH domain|nr:XRE family transcriptional regulator [Clostridiales bacterium]